MRKTILELWRFRELLISLTQREIKVRYKQTLLGMAWAILQPLSLMIIFTLVFSVFLKIKAGDVPYPLFAYSALVPWTFFSTSLSFGALAVVNNSNLVTKVYFPKEILPFASLGAAFLDFLIAGMIFFILILIYRVPLTANFIFVLPIIGLLLIFTAALILTASALNVIWRDVKFVVPLLVQVWMFITPIIYPVSQVPEKLRVFYLFNPMAPIVDNFRRVTVFGESPNWLELLIAAVISIVVFLLSYIFFKHKEKVFADII